MFQSVSWHLTLILRARIHEEVLSLRQEIVSDLRLGLS